MSCSHAGYSLKAVTCKRKRKRFHTFPCISLRRPVAPAQLQRALDAHARSFTALYGDEVVTPKFHYGIAHMVPQLERMGFLPACFVLERKHKVAKRFGDHVVNTSAQWDRGCSRDVTAVHVAAVQRAAPGKWCGGACLLNPRVPGAELSRTMRTDFQLGSEAPVLVSREMRCSEFERCMKGDVVLIGSVDAPRIIGEVQLHAEVSGAPMSLIRHWEIVSSARKHWKCRQSDTCSFCCASDITCALVWGGRDLRTVLKPFRS